MSILPPISRLGVALFGLVALGGCISRGPHSITQQRGSYTAVISLTDKEELLTNIVRLAYSDPPVFFQVSSVTASPSVEYGTDSEIKLGDGSAPSPLAVAKPKVVIKDSPTIVYKPLLGREFSAELMMPFDIRPVFLMLDNGFDFSVVAQLLFKSMNGLSNSRSATVAQRREFRRVTDAISRLIKSGDLRLGTPADGLRAGGGHVVGTMPSGALASGDGLLVANALGLDPTKADFKLKSGLVSEPDSIAISSRSLLALLSYLSNYVEAPPEHRALVWPTEARDEPDRLMVIRSAKTRPEGADPAIFYQGYWFYIRADDLRSRNTLYLLRLLFNLQAQASSGADTVQLTLPVK
jgi:hypothetical protein